MVDTQVCGFLSHTQLVASGCFALLGGALRWCLASVLAPGGVVVWFVLGRVGMCSIVLLCVPCALRAFFLGGGVGLFFPCFLACVLVGVAVAMRWLLVVLFVNWEDVVPLVAELEFAYCKLVLTLNRQIAGAGPVASRVLYVLSWVLLVGCDSQTAGPTLLWPSCPQLGG